MHQSMIVPPPVRAARGDAYGFDMKLCPRYGAFDFPKQGSLIFVVETHKRFDS